MSDDINDIDRARTEIRRLIAESDKFVAEQRKLMAESEKFSAEQRKLMAEAAKYERERWWQPVLAIAGLIGGLLGAAAFIAKVIG